MLRRKSVGTPTAGCYEDARDGCEIGQQALKCNQEGKNKERR